MGDIPGRAMRITIEGAPGVGKSTLLSAIYFAFRGQYTFIADEDNAHAALVVKVMKGES